MKKKYEVWSDTTMSNKKRDIIIPTQIEGLTNNTQYNLANMICTLTLMASELTEIEEEIYLCCVIPVLATLNEQYYGN